LLHGVVAERVTVFCFAASYAVALALELYRLYRPRPVWAVVAVGVAAARSLVMADLPQED